MDNDNQKQLGTSHNPTRFQEECWWDCQIISSRLLKKAPTTPEYYGFEARANPLLGQAIANPECLSDCFQDEDSECLASLIADVAEFGTCNKPDNPANFLDLTGWKPLSDPCTAVNGICSDKTVELLEERKCLISVDRQPAIIKNTILRLIQWSCNDVVYREGGFSNCADTGLSCSVNGAGTTDDEAARRSGDREREPRLAPVSLALVTDVTKTTLNYNNTRHRYPWICSLRTKGIVAEHVCAVTVLSVPPQPTIIIGPAHCTYLCKDGDSRGGRLDSCCCTTEPPPLGCQEDQLRCGSNPGAAEMTPDEVVIICGEWETGPTPQRFSGEEYNVDLKITEIVRHPDFAAELGVEGGSDIAVFKILEGGPQLNINPICLPDLGMREPKTGFQSGWSNPPPLYYFRFFGNGFLSFVTDTFKQWHYKLKIEEECKEPTKSEAFDADIKYPSKAYYPPGLICAKDVTFRFCPTAGDSGSPLMVKVDDRSQRYYIQGILSYLKGCERFTMTEIKETGTTPEGIRVAPNEKEFTFLSFTESPLAYTKISCFLPWVAGQFGLSYQAADDEACRQGTGQKPPFNSTHEYESTCRETPGLDLSAIQEGSEYPCIFPFYFKERLYNSCAVLETTDFVVPVWSCPVNNITTRFNGINYFGPDIDPRKGYCLDVNHFWRTCGPAECNPNDPYCNGCDPTVQGCDASIGPPIPPCVPCDVSSPTCERQIDPSDTSCEAVLIIEGETILFEDTSREWRKVPPFKTCKTDCSGGKHLV